MGSGWIDLSAVLLAYLAGIKDTMREVGKIEGSSLVADFVRKKDMCMCAGINGLLWTDVLEALLLT